VHAYVPPTRSGPGPPRRPPAFRKDLQREEDLDREAGELLDRHLGAAGAAEANTRILFQKIKERLARERGIVL
jgi:hypothetical protein